MHELAARDPDDEEQPSTPPAAAQFNTAASGGTVYAVQNGDMVFSGAVPDGRALFEYWERFLRSRPTGIRIGRNRMFRLERAVVLARVVEQLVGLGPGEAVIVRGDPGVGKSSLLLRAVDELRTRSSSVLVADLSAMARNVDAMPALLDAAGPMDDGRPGLRGHLVVDGAEAMQYVGQAGAEVVFAALQAGFALVLISRDDAVDTLRGALCDMDCTVREVVVPALSDPEVAEVVAVVPELANLVKDHRSRWLLGRLAVVDLLQRAGLAGVALPAVLASEADLYNHVWRGLVLRARLGAAGVVPENRAAVLISLAEALLTGRRALFLNGVAVASLRSDGILAPLGEQAATSAEEYLFAHDMMRDFATIRRLLLTDGPEVLKANGPRWAVRASRVYCQIRLESAVGAVGPFLAQWDQMHRQFQTLAELHGTRWAEVPWEAVLSAAWCPAALDALTELLNVRPELVGELLRCAELRFGGEAESDAVVAAPVVTWLAEHRPILQGCDDESDRFVVAWLRAVSRQEVDGVDVAQYGAVRGKVLAVVLAVPRSEGEHSPLLVEALALLGADGGSEAAELLRGIARDRGADVMAAVDRPDSVRSLATTDPTLLAELATAYYLPGTHPEQRHRGVLGWSIRDHEFLGLLAPRGGAWWRGPFAALLQREPMLGVQLARRLAAVSVLDLEHGDIRPDGRGEYGPAPAFEADLVGLGVRRYAGGSTAWAWYRGSLNGPQPCISALMALEWWADQLVGCGAITVRTAAALLASVGTAAGAGLAYGLLVRHLDDVTDELDEFLAVPAVWEMEVNRVAMELYMKPAVKDLPGSEMLQLTLPEVAMRLVVAAQQRDDVEAVDRLCKVAARLRAASGDLPDPQVVRSWADYLDTERYAVRQEDGYVSIAVVHGDDLAEELGARQAELAPSSAKYGLLADHALRPADGRGIALPGPIDLEKLNRDLRAARGYTADPAADESGMSDALCAIAGTAVRAAAEGVLLPLDDLAWSVDTLLHAAAAPVDADPAASQLWSASQSAGFSLPCLLLPAVRAQMEPLGAERVERVRQALLGLGSHPLHDVRGHFAVGLAAVWSAPCRQGTDDCHHAVAWAAVESSVELASADTGRASPCPAAEAGQSLAYAMRQVTGEEMALATLRTAAVAVLEATRGTHCRVEHAKTVRPEVLAAYARTAAAWTGRGYHVRSTDELEFVRALLLVAAAEPAVAEGYADRLAESGVRFESAQALGEFLRAAKTAATYDAGLRPMLAAVWPRMMEVVLTQPSIRRRTRFAGAWFTHDMLLEEAVPNPTLSIADIDPDATLRAVGSRWIDAAVMADLIMEWATVVRGTQSAVLNLVLLVRTQPAVLQNDPGLGWIRRLAVGRDGEVESRSDALVEWLGEIEPFLTAPTRAHFRAIVDGLALVGHPEAPALQQLEG